MTRHQCVCAWPCEHRPIYTREDLIRVVLGQQWAVAIACAMCAKPNPAYLAAVLARLPCAVDVVDNLP